MNWFKNKIDNSSTSISTSSLTSSSSIKMTESLNELIRVEVESQQEFLKKVQYADIDFFNLKGYECWAKVVRVWDGDSFYVVFFLNGKPVKYRVRLYGIDTAEDRSKDPAEHVWAMKSKDRLIELIGGELIYLKCHEFEKYGRLLAEAYWDPGMLTSFNQTLLDEKLAYKYYGKTREPFREWAPPEAFSSPSNKSPPPTEDIIIPPSSADS